MRRSSGFTLIEILVVIAIIGMLSAVVTVYALRGSQTSRDAKRQADLKLLQAAVESYRVDNGRYPAGCNAAGSWSGETGTDFECLTSDKRYITGLAPKYIRTLPRDPNRGSCKDTTGKNCGYAYVTNAEGTVYKLIAMNTVESEEVTPAHQLASCDFTGVGANDIRREQGGDGWCGAYYSGLSMVQTESDVTHQCNQNSGRFKASYAVWGGFAPLRGTNALIDIGIYSCIGGFCVNPNPSNPLADPLNSFIRQSDGSEVLNPDAAISSGGISAATKSALRVRAVLGTTEITCK